MNFLKIKIILLTVGKEEVTHFPTKWEALEEKKDCNSTQPNEHLLRILDRRTILKLFYNSSFFAGEKKKKTWHPEFIRAAMTFQRLPWAYSGWEQPKALRGLIWVVNPTGSGLEKQKPLQVFKMQAISYKEDLSTQVVNRLRSQRRDRKATWD